MEFFALNLDAFADSDARHPLMRFATRAQHWLNRNSRGGSRRKIAAHYDLGNDFYGHWLDQTMTYSSACFDGADLPLAQAQENKYARMLAMLDARPGQRILEIGCGWGGFAEYAARQGMHVIGLTLSRSQLAYARERMERAGLADRVELRFCDYRDFDEPVDHVVSIEMFEAVGQVYWQGYFDRLARLLPPGGRAALQVITIDEALFDTYAGTPGGFIQTYIFPGGMLPTKSHLQTLSSGAGLSGVDRLHSFGLDYAATLAHWHRLFNQSRAWMHHSGFDRRFRRMWRYYLAFCEAGFRARQIDVVQFALTKAG
jgi:cyclopropane-fatty-acyl-phospholipid synthase